MTSLGPGAGERKNNMADRIKIRCQDCSRHFKATTAAAKFCPADRWRHRGQKVKKYDWTAERDEIMRKRYDGKIRNRAAEIAASFGWPAWAIKRRAQALGLCYSTDWQDWTAKEEKFLWDHAGGRTAHWIAKRLGRTETSVVHKFKRLKISRRVKSGYTMRELELCFGIDHHGIERWIKEGKLHARQRKTGRTNKQGDLWAVSDAEILEFITTHPMAFRLDKIDQFWFMDLITNGGLLKKALEAARKEAA